MKLKITVFYVLLCSVFVFHATAFAAKWNSVGTGVGFDKQVLCLYVDSAAGTLYAGGAFTTVDGITVNGIAKWNGTSWAPMGAGFTSPNAVVYAITKYGSDIYAGGYFTTSGSTTVNNIARWDGTAWQPLGLGMSTTGSYDFVSSFCVFGGDLYVGGDFTKAGTLTAQNIAKWNGTVWSTIGLFGGLDDRANVLYIHGGELYAGGNFVINVTTFNFQYRICKLTSSGWATVGTKGVGDATAYWSVKTLATYKGNLFVGGYFNVLETGATADHMAKWNGTAWATVGTTVPGVASTVTDPVRALQVYNNKLYAGGVFTAAGGVTTDNIATWNDTAWAVVDSAFLNGKVSAMAIYKGDLIVTGDFTSAGGASRGRIARYNPTVAPPPPTAIPAVSKTMHCTLSPNPATDAALLQLSSDITLADAHVLVHDFSGKMVETQQVNGRDHVVIRRNNLPAGTYIYSVYNRGEKVATGNIVFR